MERREGCRRFELHQNRIVNEAMLAEFWTAMDNSMPDSGRHRHFGVDEQASDTNDCFSLTGNGTALGEQRVSMRVFCMEFPPLSPIASASPEMSFSIRENPRRYSPNLREDEPLFSASMFN